MDSLPRPWAEERVFSLALSGGMMGSDVWTINGKRYPRTDPLVLGRGDLGRIRFSNMSPEGHPMHLHGQSFRVLAVHGRRLSHPLVKDTVDVAATKFRLSSGGAKGGSAPLRQSLPTFLDTARPEDSAAGWSEIRNSLFRHSFLVL